MSLVSEIVQGAAAGATGPASIVSTVLSIGQEWIDRIWPDKEKQAQQRADAQAHLLELTNQRESELTQAVSAVDAAQSQVNAIEAGSTSLLKSGWRPAIGWVCAGALALNFLPRAVAGVVMWVIQCHHSGHLEAYPDLGVADLLTLTLSLLGMSTLRSVEVQKGVR